MDEFRRKSDQLRDLAEEIDVRHTVWSIHEVADHMDNVAFHGTYTVQLSTDPFWSATPGHYTEEVTDPTWTNLWQVADRLVKQGGDFHHIYIEVFDEDHDTLHLWLGS